MPWQLERAFGGHLERDLVRVLFINYKFFGMAIGLLGSDRRTTNKTLRVTALRQETEVE